MTFEGTFQENKRPVVTTAPDCLVYLNGNTSLPSGSNPNRRVDIQPLIESVNVSLNVENPPGNAQVSLKVPTHYREDFFRAGDPIITTMMELQIYMKGHYKVGGEPRYYPVFWGVTQSVNHSWSGGERTVDINAQDILYWWTIQRININPSILGAREGQVDKFNVQGSGYFTRANPFSIMYSLARFAYGDSMNANIYPNARQERSEVSEQELNRMMEYWSNKWGKIRHSLRMFGPNGRVIQGSDLADLVDDRASEVKKGQDTDSSKNKNEVRRNYNQIEGGIDLSQIAPFEQVASKMGNTETWTSEFKTKMDVANTVTEALGYEFFMDFTGELVFKPPFYNLDVIPNKPVSWIRPVDVINEDYNENPPDATMIEASGSLVRNMDVGGGEAAKPRATYVDYRLVQKYGWKPTNYSSTFYGTGTGGSSPQRLFSHLVDRLDRENVGIHNGTVTVPLRPEMRLGYPIYIEHKDAYYYVKSISHTFSYGSQCTSSIEIKGKRSKFYAPFDSWSTASANQTGKEPEPGATADPNYEPVNIYNRPIEKRSGNPMPDKNVNLVFQEQDRDTPETFDEEERKSEKVQRQLVSMRSQFALTTSATYVYKVDEDKGEDVERNDKGEKVSGPLTTLNPVEVEVDGNTEYGAEFPVSDERGYEVIGSYEYGRSASVTREGINFEADDTYTDVQRLLHMSPEDIDIENPFSTFSGTNTRVDPSKDDNLKVNPNNYGRRLNELQPKGDQSTVTAATTRNIVKNKSKDDFNEEGQNVEAIDVTTHRNFEYTNQVERWRDTMEKARNQLGVSEERYPDRLLLGIMHVESNGRPDARRRNDDGKLSQFCGSFQIGEGNAETFGHDNTYFQGRSSNDERAVLRSAKHFIKYQEEFADDHQYNEELMAVTWNGGPVAGEIAGKLSRGEADKEYIMSQEREYDDGFLSEQEAREVVNQPNQKSAIETFLKSPFGGQPSSYVAKYRDARSVWNRGKGEVSNRDKIVGSTGQDDEEQETIVFKAGSDESPKNSPESDNTGKFATKEKAIQQDLSSNLFTKKLEENLENLPDSLPSGIQPPRDPNVVDIINQYLGRIYKRAFEEEEQKMREVRGLQKENDSESESEPETQQEERTEEPTENFQNFEPEDESSEDEDIYEEAVSGLGSFEENVEPSIPPAAPNPGNDDGGGS